MFEGSQTTVLFEELGYADILPVQWRRLDAASTAATRAVWTEHNVRLLQACAAIEEQGYAEKVDENAPNSADLQRLDFKLNLLLDLVGQVVAANLPRPAAIPLRFNAHGAIWQASEPHPKQGEHGVFEVYLRECLVQPLRLVGHIDSIEPDGTAEAHFDPPGEATADLIEKLAFRRHRRLVKGSRQPRRG